MVEVKTLMDFELEEIKRKKLLKMAYGSEGRKGLRVCVPTYGWKGLDDYVCEHFGRAPTFTVVDLSSKKVEVVPNTSQHMGGMGYPPEIMQNLGVEVVICSGLGPRAIKMFEQFGIEVYVGASGTVKEAIQAWQAGKLQMATDENACKMHKHQKFL